MLVDDPMPRLYEGNLEYFCLALEGVSHFLYLIWNASFDRSVILLEMELQAEIDKFMMLGVFLEKQNKRLRLRQLRKLLFETAGFHRQLSETEKQRYQDASHLAEKYCFIIESDCLANRSRQEMLFKLRRFYRLTQSDKLSRINFLH